MRSARSPGRSPRSTARAWSGSPGGGEKCALLTERLGFDAAVDHRAADWHEQLVAATPNGIDVDFENVGGEIMDAVFARLNLRARVALCGLISGYNDADPPPGPRSFPNLLVQRALLQGFIVLDHFDRMTEAVAELAGWIREGKLEPLETVVEGFEQLPTAINMLFDGANTGKLVCASPTRTIARIEAMPRSPSGLPAVIRPRARMRTPATGALAPASTIGSDSRVRRTEMLGFACGAAAAGTPGTTPALERSRARRRQRSRRVRRVPRSFRSGSFGCCNRVGSACRK